MAGVTTGLNRSDRVSTWRNIHASYNSQLCAPLRKYSRGDSDFRRVGDMMSAVSRRGHARPSYKVSGEAARFAETQCEADFRDGQIARQQLGTRELTPQTCPHVLDTLAFMRQTVTPSPRPGSKTRGDHLDGR